MCTKTKVLSAILTAAILLLIAPPARSATEAEKQAAIDAGLAWLATQQQADGRWIYDGSPETDVSATGAALLAFIEEGHTPTSGTAYSLNVVNGLNYLFLNAQTVPIAVQPAGNPDTNGNGIGVKFVLGGDNGRDIYTTGLALLPIAAVDTPGTVIGVGSQTGRTYANVIQDVVDYFAFAQSDPDTGPYRGGWRYYANFGSSDNSTSQWPVIALLYAQGAGATVPGWVATELAFWTVYIQEPDGGSDYDGTWNYSNVSRTGTLLSEQVFSGAGAGTAAALNYLNSQWLTTANGTWEGNFGHPYAMWAAYKGLELTIGLDDESTITNLHPDPGDVDNPNHDWNWWEDYCEYLVTTQVGGTWPGYDYWTGPLATAWYINILAATEIPPPETVIGIDIKPGSCPNPFNGKSEGSVPVAILVSEGFDLTRINVATIELEGVPALDNWEIKDSTQPYDGDPEGCEDCFDADDNLNCDLWIGDPADDVPGMDGIIDGYCGDGIPDLVVKFDAKALATAIGPRDRDACVELTLMGELFDGTKFEFSDFMIIRTRIK